ncbi:alanine--tRNA ligase-related protein [Actinacidiphila glaucinigra]|uniref:alanine--tRNA ligase-related protein n=1 Tax=Actinacidiphila glaucinigra TaxID=235986 RepID=UPI0036E104F7
MSRADIAAICVETAGPAGLVGFRRVTARTRVTGLSNTSGRPLSRASAGTAVALALADSPFHAEGGGQACDTGAVRSGDTVVQVTEVRRGASGHPSHRGRVLSGAIAPGDVVDAEADGPRRLAIARSHTAAHVLHHVLRGLLGEQAVRLRSLAGPGRLVYEFRHRRTLAPAELTLVEERVNSLLLADPEVTAGRRTGAPVVSIGDFSREQCGGTHVSHGSLAGTIRVRDQRVSAPGFLRIEVWTGFDALRAVDLGTLKLRELTELLEDPARDPVDALRSRLGQLAQLRQEVERLRRADRDRRAAALADRAELVRGGLLVTARVDGLARSELPVLATAVAERLASGLGLAVLGGADGPVTDIAAATGPALLARGVRAADVLLGAANLVGGEVRGDGTAAVVTGSRVAVLAEALLEIRGAARAALAGARH